MFKQLTVVALLMSVILSGCATSEKSILLGSSIGLGIGAGIGSNVGNQNGAVVGAAIGALAGGLIGYSGYQEKRKKELAAQAAAQPGQFEMFTPANANSNRPKLKPALVRVRYVEDQVKDGTFIPAHFEYEISEPAHWEGSK